MAQLLPNHEAPHLRRLVTVPSFRSSRHQHLQRRAFTCVLIVALITNEDNMEATGLAIALVTVGSQLVREITGYLDGLKRREFEIEAARVQLDILDNTLKSISNEVTAIGPLENTTRDNVERGCKLVRQQIVHISEFVKALKLDKDDASGRRVQIKTRTREFIYPFRRESLKELQSELRDLNQVLSMALQPLN